MIFFILQEYRDDLVMRRKLRGDEVQKALKLLDMKCPKSSIRKELKEDTGKNVRRKDLDNLSRKLRHPDEDTLQATKDLLVNVYRK